MKAAEAIRRWLDGDEAAEDVVRALADAEEWPPVKLPAATTQRLVAMAHEALGRDPNRSVWISRLAIRIARKPADEGDAWREYATALCEVGEYDQAQAAAERARAVYRHAPRTEHNQAVLGATEGLILHERGESLRGLRRVEESAQTLLRLKDKKRYVRTRSIYASILFDLGRYPEAAEMYSAMAELAKQEGDGETLAHAVLLIGRCAVNLGDIARARQCFDTALEMFEQLGQRSEMPRVRHGIAEILIAHGRINEAISELYKARAEFLSMNLPVLAALVALDVVDLLRTVGRSSEIELLCGSCPEALPQAVHNAFAALRECAGHADVTAEDVDRVRGCLERLPLEA